MGILGRLTRNTNQDGTERDTPRLDRFDPFLGDTELRGAYRAVVDGDWHKLESFLDRSPKSWMFSSIVTSEIVDMERVVFERWVDFEESARARTYYAAAQIRDAFLDRETAVPDAPDPDDPPTNGAAPGAIVETDPDTAAEERRFRTRLEAAETILYEVVRDRPALADPWVFLLISGRDLGAELEEIRERFENAHSREPFRPDACRQYLQSLSKKWGGSTVATFDFARWVTSAAPPASGAHEALPVAHLEKGLMEWGGADLASYLIQPDVVAELATALAEYLRAIPSPAPVESLGVLNAFALAISADSEATAQLVTETFARIANRPTSFPWSVYSEDITGVFSEIQVDQLRYASRY